jgi:hypothetical protein
MQQEEAGEVKQGCKKKVYNTIRSGERSKGLNKKGVE